MLKGRILPLKKFLAVQNAEMEISVIRKKIHFFVTFLRVACFFFFFPFRFVFLFGLVSVVLITDKLENTTCNFFANPFVYKLNPKPVFTFVLFISGWSSLWLINLEWLKRGLGSCVLYLTVSEEVFLSWEAPKHQGVHRSVFSLANFTVYCAVLG